MKIIFIKSKVNTIFEKSTRKISKQTFRKFSDHKICVIKKEHVEDEALKYLLNLPVEKPQVTFMRVILAAVALSCTEVA